MDLGLSLVVVARQQLNVRLVIGLNYGQSPSTRAAKRPSLFQACQNHPVVLPFNIFVFSHSDTVAANSFSRK